MIGGVAGACAVARTAGRDDRCGVQVAPKVRVAAEDNEERDVGRKAHRGARRGNIVRYGGTAAGQLDRINPLADIREVVIALLESYQ